jgi:excinuclease UvrABC ATPase subunit
MNIQIDFPTVRINCPNCKGSGFTLDPRLQGHVYTFEDIQDDPEFFEDMRHGTYDVPCSECEGSGRTDGVDVDALTPNQRIVFDAWQSALAERESENYYRDRERRAEFGY